MNNVFTDASGMVFQKFSFQLILILNIFLQLVFYICLILMFAKYIFIRSLTGFEPSECLRYELSGCGSESRCRHLNFRYRARSSKELLDMQAPIEYRFTLKLLRDMTKTYRHFHQLRENFLFALLS